MSNQIKHFARIAPFVVIPANQFYKVTVQRTFSLCRLDILPTGDLGVRKGMQRLYGLPELPSPDEMRALADRQGWAPYRSVASWYMWQVIDQL